MVVDDSAVVRGLITRMLDADPDVEVVASVGNGQLAVQTLERTSVDVAILDIEMPVLDGLSALPKLLAKDPGIKVIIASTLTLKNAEISLQALQAGAADYLPKPTASREIGGESDFKRDLLSKVKALGRARRHDPRRRSGLASGTGAPTAEARGQRPFAAARDRVPAARPGGPVQLRPARSAAEPVDVIAIGSSTGGPQALFAVLGAIQAAGGVKQPILITQHMPATFTTILANHISRAAGMPAHEATDREAIQAGHVYVAPGGYHMMVEANGMQRILRLSQDPPENFCRPSVDPMFRSVARVYGRRALAVVLTGMGSDGTKGGTMIVEAGGTIIAQDEATSVVWGMPGAIAQAGLCSAVLPLADIGPYISKVASKR